MPHDGIRSGLERFGLGTVQFGLDYGITNAAGKVGEDGVAAILSRARELGVRVLDTARHYGDSEQVLGRLADRARSFRIVSKTPAAGADEIGGETVATFDRALDRSLAMLDRTTLDGLLLHHGRDMLRPGGARLADFLRAAKDDGRAAKVGVSVYDAAEIDGILAQFTPDIVQLPINVLDQRLIRSGHLAKLKDLGVEIHARSLFLQGLLLQPATAQHPYFRPIRSAFDAFDAALDARGEERLAACVGFALSRPEIDTVLIGVTSVTELDQIAAAARSDGGDYAEFGHLVDDPRYLDPSQWRI